MNQVAEKQRIPRSCSQGFTLVELMIVVAVCAILATVAVPAYMNQVNRSRQTDAVATLMQAKMEQEIFWAGTQNARYSGTIGCLPSFATAACLAACGGGCANNYLTSSGYNLSVTTANTSTFTILASKTVAGTVDRLSITPALEKPNVQTPNALKFSLFKMMFGS